ncbi:exodeoxyribonuclease VII large subunit [Myxococcota bacterium]|nr:exodeoxyribonuclease VII large subunit [Myxococcota bacterium]MBU1381280.1 exodeoxyribonuclease VII large subunit [Myxococcota bacterium]MBU1495992.1 exodeoxyribonuclease VII large subunit [Myxococcota bacterium]
MDKKKEKSPVKSDSGTLDLFASAGISDSDSSTPPEKNIPSESKNRLPVPVRLPETPPVPERREPEETVKSTIPPEKSELVYTVSDFINSLNLVLEKNFSRVWIEGEIGNISSRNNVRYFSIKDSKSLIDCVLFVWKTKIDFNLEEGLKVRVRGYLNVFPSRGKLSFNVEIIEQTGAGSLNAAFELLKKKLEKEGLFDEKYKKKLPAFPRRVAVITSPEGAALRDILKVASGRIAAEIIIVPAVVQGKNAPDDIVRALGTVSRMEDIDVVICGRGGGSAEDLSCFNDEKVARAIFECRVPVVSAVGHQTDFTLADFTADRRAATPTEAAEIVFSDKILLKRTLSQYSNRLIHSISLHMEARKRKMAQIALKMGDPGHFLDMKAQELDQFSMRMERAVSSSVRIRRMQLERLKSSVLKFDVRGYYRRGERSLIILTNRMNQAVLKNTTNCEILIGSLKTRLSGLDPMKVLERGYAMVRDSEGTIITDSSMVEKGENLTIHLRKGKLEALVENAEE